MSNLKSTNRLAAAFAAAAPRTALIPYITAGDPSVRVTPLLMQALADAGADIIELGVPFSDPMADGPVIQRAAQRAIERGVGLTHVLQMVAQFRRGNDHTPVVLMGYANPIERMGQAAFVKNASAAGVDGVLVVDYPPEEMVDFAALLDKASIAPIFLLAPTSVDERIRLVARVARGYVYYVSLRGVTGAGNLDVASVKKKLDQIRRYVSLPVGVGFGIRDAQTAQSLAGFSDAVVIGSKLIETMESAVVEAGEGEADAAAIKAASTWLRGIRQALEEAVRR
jgi:tryptophan synthase alpha chain